MASSEQTGPILKLQEVAVLLSAHTNTVRRWSDQGILKGYRIGPRGDRRFTQEDITRFLGELKANGGDVRKADSAI